ncbi:MAG: ribbon-helix-helix protein, CopG family [Terriglobales bacterium]
MRTSKTISFSLPPAQFQKAAQLARKENRTMSELIREALRRYEDNAVSAAAARAAFSLALKAVREDAERKGVNRLSLREINAEVAAVRRARSRKAPAAASA